MKRAHQSRSASHFECKPSHSNSKHRHNQRHQVAFEERAPETEPHSLHPVQRKPRQESQAPASSFETALAEPESFSPSARSPSQQKPLAWVLSDKSGVRQAVLQERGFVTTNFHHDLHSKGQLHLILQELQAQRPSVLWIRLAGPAAGSGNRVDSRRTDNLVRLARAQMDSGRRLVIEANAKSGAWDMVAVSDLCRMLHSSRHAWCRHERTQSANERPCNAVLQVCTNFDIPDMSECNCHPGATHVNSKAAAPRISSVLQSLVDVALKDGRRSVSSFTSNGFNGPVA